VLSAALGLLPIAPPEHIHEAEEQGHVHVVIHRHLKTHGILEHDAEHHQTLDDNDGPVLTLATSYNVPALPVIGGAPRTLGAWIDPPPPRRVERVLADVDILIHGPPRAPTPPRAPPVSPTL
jgi:hypothetical protein